MDLVLEYLDPLCFDQFYSYFGNVPRDYIYRQAFSIWSILAFGGQLMYLVFASVSYVLLFDRSWRRDRRFLPYQELKELWVALSSIPFMGVITVPIFLGELYGFSKLHDGLGEHGWVGLVCGVVWFIIFTDAFIYLAHRWLHHPWIYPIHKLHHKWKVPTPFASHAFHPLDGFAQGFAYHLYVYLFPMNKITYLILFLFVNLWTVSIHDGTFLLSGTVINSAAHHTVHHLKYNYNYGQYFTFWDKIGGSHLDPATERPQEKQLKTK